MKAFYLCSKHGRISVSKLTPGSDGSAPPTAICRRCGAECQRSKRQRNTNRGSISVSAATYAKVKAYCAGRNRTMSSLVHWLTDDL